MKEIKDMGFKELQEEGKLYGIKVVGIKRTELEAKIEEQRAAHVDDAQDNVDPAGEQPAQEDNDNKNDGESNESQAEPEKADKDALVNEAKDFITAYEVALGKTPSKADTIRGLLATGKFDRGTIAKALGVKYQQVYQVEAQMKAKAEKEAAAEQKASEEKGE